MEINMVKTTSLRNQPKTRSDVSKIMFAVNFSAAKHKNQRRKNSENVPYINHPIGVADILIEEGKIEDVNWICAAILHDTVEDTDTSFEELNEHFGPTVASIVEELTDAKLLSKSERKRLQVVNSSHKSIGAKTVGMCDKIYNLRDLVRLLPSGWTEQRRVEYFVWARKVTENYYHANSTLASVLQEFFEKHKNAMEELEKTSVIDSEK